MTTTRDELVKNPEGLGKREDVSVPCTPLCLLNRPTPRDPQTRGRWGEILNNNWDIIEDAFVKADDRLDSLEEGGEFLPTAIANRVGGNFVRNNLFGTPLSDDPTIAAQWTSEFLNQAEGFTVLDASTKVIGKHSQRLTINKITNSGAVISPYPGIATGIIEQVDSSHPYYDSNDIPFPCGFSYIFQSLSLLPDTTYTASAYGKVEPPNVGLNISVQWRIGVALKNAIGNIVKMFVSPVQTKGVGQNASSESGPSSFARNYFTFTTPDSNFIAAEIWLIVEGKGNNKIGSGFFDAVQVEQAEAATRVDSWSVVGDDMYVGGNLTIFGSISTSQENFVIDSDLIVNGSTRLGDNENEDELLVKCQNSSFLGNVDIAGKTVIGNNANISSLEVNRLNTYFKQNIGTGNGGNVNIEGNLNVAKDTVLGSNVLTSTTTIVGTLDVASAIVTAGDLTVDGNLKVSRNGLFGEGTEILDTFILDYSTTFGGGSYKSITLTEPINFFGDVRLHDELFVNGDVVLGSLTSNIVDVSGNLNVGVNSAVGNDLSVENDVRFGSNSNYVDLNFYVDTFNLLSSGSATLDFDADLTLSGSLEVGSGASDILTANVGMILLGSANTTSCKIESTITNVSEDLYVGSDGDGSLSVADNIMAGGFVTIDGNLSAGGTNINLGIIGGDLVVNSQNIVFGSSGNPSDLQVTGNLQVDSSVMLGSDIANDTVGIIARRVDIVLDNTTTVGKFNIGGNPSSPGYSNGGVSIHQSGNVEIAGKLTVDGVIDPIKVLIENTSGSGESSSLEIKEGTGTVFNVALNGETTIDNSLIVAADGSFGGKLTTKDLDISGTLTIKSGAFIEFGDSLVETRGISLLNTFNPFSSSQAGLYSELTDGVRELFYSDPIYAEKQLTKKGKLNVDLNFPVGLIWTVVGDDTAADYDTLEDALANGAKRIMVISDQNFGSVPLIISDDDIIIEFSSGVMVEGTGTSVIKITGNGNKIIGGEITTTSDTTELLVIESASNKNRIRDCNFNLPSTSMINAVHVYGNYNRLDSTIDLNSGVSSVGLRIEAVATGTNYDGMIIIP